MTGSVDALSEREKDALRLLLEGHDAKSIARNLGISVHTVNERLRASRRKLKVSSSREAARLLARSEQRSPNSVVYSQMGIASDAADVNKDLRPSGRKGVEHPIALAVGGTLIMSFIIAVAMFAWISAEGTTTQSPPKWRTSTAIPARYEQVRNTIRLDGNRLLWNEKQISEPDIRQFLDLTTMMEPQPAVILRYSAQTQPKRVQQVRLLIEDIIRCTPDHCLEITLPPA